MSWSGGYVDAHGATLTDVDAFSARELPAPVLADFRAYASRQGVNVPADGDALLQELLLTNVAYAKWGTEGTYRVYARRDGEVKAAMAGFAQARAMVH